MTTPENPPRWVPDPLGRHQYRYWDGAQWTEHVSDNGLVATDPPVAHAPGTPTTVDPTATGAPGGPGISWSAAAASTTPDTPPDAPGPGIPPAVATAPVGGSVGPPDPASAAGAAGWGAPQAAGWGSAASTWSGTMVPTSAPAPGTGSAAWAQTSRPYDPTAVLGRRYGAFFIDAAICLVAFLIFFFPFATTHTRAEALRIPGCHLSSRDSSQVECDNKAVITVNDTVYEANLGAWVALCAAFTLLYFALVEGIAGGSLGKQMTGIRVVNEHGEKIGIGRSFLRWLLFAIDGPLSFFLCGIITSSVSQGHRRLGDMAATTYVVGRADTSHPVVLR